MTAKEIKERALQMAKEARDARENRRQTNTLTKRDILLKKIEKNDLSGICCTKCGEQITQWLSPPDGAEDENGINYKSPFCDNCAGV